MRNDLIVKVWDVGHGLSITVQTPDVLVDGVIRRRWLQYDANNNTERSVPFSPITHMYLKNWNTIDRLIISHPDQDHIGDLPALEQLQNLPQNPLKVRVFSRNRQIPSDMISVDRRIESHAKHNYRNFDEVYIAPLSPIDELTPVNFGGLAITETYLPFTEDLDENECSVLSVIQYGNLYLVLPGDLTSFGFTRMVENGQVPLPRNDQVVILIAPHHGSETVEAGAFLDFFIPNIVLASAGNQDTNSDAIYSSAAVIGYPVVGETTVRKFVTTKLNNSIEINVSPGRYPVITQQSHS